MRFGVFYEHQLPRPWTEDGEYRLLNESLDQIELADRLGYDYAWEVEHHFLEEYSHSSAPEVFLGAASQRTSRIRLGHGIIQLTTNHPARVAERVATLDLVSHGRVELGLGESATTTELHPFDRRFRDKREVWEDGVRALLPMFWSDAWEYHGAHFDFPLRNVIPKPRQKPAPAAVGRVLAARDHPDGGHAGDGRARVPVRLRRGRPGLGARLLQRVHQAARQALRLPDEPEHRGGLPVHVRADRRGGGRPGRGLVLLPVRARATTAPTRPGCRARSSYGRSSSPTRRPPRARRRAPAASSARPRRSDPGCPSSSSRTSTR